MAPPRRVLLAGATGLVGRAVLQLLLRQGSSVDVLARRIVDLGGSSRVQLRVVDFGCLPRPLPSVDDVVIALGTTIKVAGSQAAFRAVDFDAVVAVAGAARAAGATRLAVVSALGADPASTVFYNRVKGEMEAAIATLGYDSVTVARPSLLLGDRATLGQPVRRIEAWAMRLGAPMRRLVPRSWRPIAAADVAAALVDSVCDGRPGVRVLSSAQMQRDGG